MKNYRFSPFLKTIECVCGNEINVKDYYFELVNELDPDIIDNIRDQEEFSCPKCHTKYELLLDLSAHIVLDDYKLKKIGIDYYDKDNRLVSPEYFVTLQSGEEVNLWDGEYIVNDKVYRVLDGKIFYILSAEVDENQMNIFELEGAAV